MTSTDYAAAKLEIKCMYKQALRAVVGNRSAGQRLRWRVGK